MSDRLAFDLQYAQLAFEAVRQSPYWLPIVLVTIAAAVVTAVKRPAALPLIVLSPLCTVVVSNWFWFEKMMANVTNTEQDFLECTTIALLVGLAVGIVLAVGLAVWRDRDINDKPLADPVGIAKAYLGLPIASLAADFLTIFALGVAISFTHDPMGWILAGILLAGLFGSCGGGVVLLIIV